MCGKKSRHRSITHKKDQRPSKPASKQANIERTIMLRSALAARTSSAARAHKLLAAAGSQALAARGFHWYSSGSGSSSSESITCKTSAWAAATVVAAAAGLASAGVLATPELSPSVTSVTTPSSAHITHLESAADHTKKRPDQKYEALPPPPRAPPQGAGADTTSNRPPARPDLPVISLDEVAEHCDEDSLWYTFRGAVYDMTFFVNGHPGGTPVRMCKQAQSAVL